MSRSGPSADVAPTADVAQVYTVRIGTVDLTQGGSATLFTVPEGNNWILTDLEVTNGDADPHQLWVQLNSGSVLLAYVWREPAAAGATTQHWEGRVALVAGEHLLCGTTGLNATFLASGWQLG